MKVIGFEQGAKFSCVHEFRPKVFGIEHFRPFCQQSASAKTWSALPPAISFSAVFRILGRPSPALAFSLNEALLLPENCRSDCLVELADAHISDQIVSSDGLISVCGFGYLLSETSARSTFPELINYRIGKLSRFGRVFAHAASVFFERGITKPETKEISSLSVEPCESETFLITIFEIQRSEV